MNNEIDKIISCFKDKKIDLKKIDLLIDIRTNDDFNLLKDEALNGNKINTNRLLADTVFEAENNIYYLSSINQRINKLNEIESMKQENLEERNESLKYRMGIFCNKNKPHIKDNFTELNGTFLLSDLSIIHA